MLSVTINTIDLEYEGIKFDEETKLSYKYEPVNGISSNDDEIYKVYIQVVDYLNHNEEIIKLMKLNKLNKFNISLRDEDLGDFLKDEKCLVNCMKDSSNSILMNIWGLLEYNNFKELFTYSIPFNEKISKAIWRGSTTGSDELYMNKDLQKYSRLELIKKSIDYPSLLDCKFSSAVQYVLKRHEKFRKYIDLRNIELNKLSKKEMIKYKYILVPDGNVGTHSYYWILSSGSVPIKQKSEFKQYFESEKFCCHEIIKENVHYIQVNEDFSDLVEKIEYLNNNPDIAEKIANNAKEYAMKYFTPTYFKIQFFHSLSYIIKN